MPLMGRVRGVGESPLRGIHGGLIGPSRPSEGGRRAVEASGACYPFGIGSHRGVTRFRPKHISFPKKRACSAVSAGFFFEFKIGRVLCL
jgi:hypothetical protein